MRSRQEYYNRGYKFTKEELREKQRLASLKYRQSAKGKKYHSEWSLKNKERLKQVRRKYAQRTKHAAQKKWYSKNKERFKAYSAQWYKDNIETIKIKSTIYREKNKERIERMSKKYRDKPESKARRKEYCAEYYLKNKKRVNKRNKAWSQNNKDKVRKANKQNRLRNLEYYRKWYAAYASRQRKINPQFNMRERLSRRIHDALNRYIKEGKRFGTLTYTGCSIAFLVKHIEKQFKDGMNWENRNKWHIDHIRPCASFDLTDTKQQLECFHYTNLQPLWAFDNISKGKKIICGDITSPKM